MAAAAAASNAITLASSTIELYNGERVIARGLYMMNRNEKGRTICERLQQLGYQREKNIRLYGEEFHLVSNPLPDGDGFAVEGISRTSIAVRRVRLPLSLVQTVKKEFALQK
jgi:hypothetical protein